MQTGLSLIFQNHDDGLSDREVYRKELALADLAEPLGFDSVWTTEHHFTSYMLCPDPLQFLSWMAARTEKIRLGTMVVVLPWHDPVRVAEQVSMLDHMSGGRLIFGMGRGAGAVEFDGFRIPMEETRDRFIESAAMVLRGLETGMLEGEGPHHRQPPMPLRPKPLQSFHGRVYGAALSPESSTIMAELGLGIMVIPQKPWETVAAELDVHRRHYEKVHGEEPVRPITSAWIYCDRDGARAEQVARRHIGAYYESTINHYKFDGSHFARTRGYEYYDKISRSLNNSSHSTAAQNFVDLQVWGTPEQCIEKIMGIKEITGCDGFNGVFRYAGLDYGAAEDSLRLFAEEVLPEIRKY